MIPYRISNSAYVTVFTVVFVTIATNADSDIKDYYTSVVEIQKLAKAEQKILKGLLDYRIKLEHRLRLANSFVNEYEESLIPVLKNIQLKNQIETTTTDYDLIPFFLDDDELGLNLIGDTLSAHPLLSYKIIRRFGIEMRDLLNNVRETDVDAEFNSLMLAFEETARLPTEAEITGAANGLLRIQNSYAIPVPEFTRGSLGSNIETDTSLNSFDLHYVGNAALSAGNYLGAVEWFGEAYKRTTQFQDPSIPGEIVEKSLSDAIIKHNEALINHDPNLPENEFLFPEPLPMNLSSPCPSPIPTFAQNSREYALNNIYSDVDDTINFKALCKGVILQPVAARKSYTCWYKRDTPSTLISPFKMELHHENPSLIQIYEIISDSSIAHLINHASPGLSRAMVLGPPEDRNKISDVRTSSVFWMHQEDDITEKMSRSIEQATGLDAVTGPSSEKMQLQNYGAVGGHYVPHLDALFDESNPPVEDYDKVNGDRLATVMFYLSDVQKGGGTAFPRLGVVTQAVKGSAVFWYNLKKNGETDQLTLHGGCPVVYGNKWVMNKWIRINPQVFRRPCGLTQYED